MIAYFQQDGGVAHLGEVTGTIENMLETARQRILDKGIDGFGAVCLTTSLDGVPDPDIHRCLATSNYRGLKKVAEEKGISMSVIKRGRKGGRPKKS